MKFIMTFHDTSYGPDNVREISCNYTLGAQPYPVPRIGECVLDKRERRRKVLSVVYDMWRDIIKVSVEVGDV
jgi:hypothetical protein